VCVCVLILYISALVANKRVHDRAAQALVWKPLPSLVFGVMCTISGLLYVMFLPETLGQVLPDTVDEAERFGRRSRIHSRYTIGPHLYAPRGEDKKGGLGGLSPPNH